MGTLDEVAGPRQSSSAPVTLIGGTGFIGGRLAAGLLAMGRTVRVVDLVAPDIAAVEFREADVRDPDGVVRAIEGSSVVYNLAAVHRDDVKPPSLYREVNIDGAVNVANACRRLGINKLVFSSSVAVYGVQGADIAEDCSPKPTNEYGRSKLQAEQIYCVWQREAPEDRTLVIVRPVVIFGRGNRGNVYRLLRQIHARLFVMVGTGENRKSMAYVDNISAFLAHVITLNPGLHLYNYADKPDLSMNDLVSIILQELGRPYQVPARVPYVIGLLGGLACDLLAFCSRRDLPITAARVRKFHATTTYATARATSTGFVPPACFRHALRHTIKQEIGNRME